MNSPENPPQNPVDPETAHLQRLEKLASDRGQILRLEGKQALDAIFDHPQAQALVHSFAEEDLAFLIHDIGPDDAMDLIAMASERQWEYILDVESWDKDRLNLTSVTEWMGRMIAADPRRFVRWMAAEKPQLMEYLLFHSIEVVVREHDQDPSDFADGFMTWDDVFYFRVASEKYAPDATAEFMQQHQDLITTMMHLLIEDDHVFYQETLLRSASVIPAETEEEAFRLRNFRLAEKGFLPFHEAVGVFQSISVKQLKKRKKTLKEIPDPDFFVPAPISPAAMMDDDRLFAQALKKITDFKLLQQLQTEFAGVCNRLIAAEPDPVRSRDQLKAIVKKACGWISMGLERLILSDPDGRDEKTVEYIKTYPLIDLFRTGYGEIAALRHKATAWRDGSWFVKNKLPLSFWGERRVGVIGGILLSRPRFYDPLQRGNLYREFETLSDIETARGLLAEVMEWDRLFSRLSVPGKSLAKNRSIGFDTLVLTLWARHCIGLPVDPAPISLSDFRPFFADLWEQDRTPPAIKDSRKAALLKWLAEKSKQSEVDISKAMGNALEDLFDEIAENYGAVRPENLDPRFISLFLLAGDPDGSRDI